MLPRLNVSLPVDLPIDLPISLPFSVPFTDSFEAPSMPASIGELPSALGGAWGWGIAGAVLAVISLWAVRRARRMILAAAVGAAGLLIAWNAGFLPVSA